MRSLKLNGWKHMTPDISNGAKSRLQAFIHHESTAGLFLVISAALAIIAFNIDAIRPLYDGFLQTVATVTIGGFGVSKPVLL